MSTKALIGVLLAGTVGILVFLFVHLSNSSSKISIGSKQAKACARSSTGVDDCLPNVKYFDTTGHAYTAESLLGKVVVFNFRATWCRPGRGGGPGRAGSGDRGK